jgi:hypothetical protein
MLLDIIIEKVVMMPVHKCPAVCNYCANSCTHEDDVKSILNVKCATICFSAVQLMSIGSQQAAQICVICAEIYEARGSECGKNDIERWKECTRICMLCIEECKKMVA